MSSTYLIIEHALDRFTTILPPIAFLATLLVWGLFYFKKTSMEDAIKITIGSALIVLGLIVANALKPFILN